MMTFSNLKMTKIWGDRCLMLMVVWSAIACVVKVWIFEAIAYCFNVAAIALSNFRLDDLSYIFAEHY